MRLWRFGEKVGWRSLCGRGFEGGGGGGEVELMKTLRILVNSLDTDAVREGEPKKCPEHSLKSFAVFVVHNSPYSTRLQGKIVRARYLAVRHDWAHGT
jgi:hypothetical protein